MIFNKNIIRLALTVVSVIGVPLTSFISIKCYEKAKDEETTENKVKQYIPAIVSGVATSASIIASHRISTKEIAALTATASFAIASRNKLEEAVKPYIPKEKLDEINKDIKKNALIHHNKPTIEKSGKGALKVLEAYSGRLFYSSIEDVLEAEKKLSRHFMDGEAISMNTFYRYLGISKTDFGDCWGWVPDDELYPRWYEDNPLGFENSLEEDEDGNSLLVITIMSHPIEGWLEEAKNDCLQVR